MNIPFTSVSFEDGAWTYTWDADSGDGPFRVVLWGVLLDVIDENSFTYSSVMFNSDTDAPPVEVVAEGELAVSERNRCYLILQWHRVDCDRYDVEYRQGESGSTWSGAVSIQDDPLMEIRTYITELLEDQETIEWRVIAIDENKREGEPLNYSWKIVRPPNPPTDIELSCVGGTLTVE